MNPESDQSAVVMENRMAMIIRLHDFLYVTLYFTPPYFTLDLLLYGFLTLLFLSGQASYPALPTLSVTRKSKKSDLVKLEEVSQLCQLINLNSQNVVEFDIWRLN